MIRVSDSQEFKRLLEALAHDVGIANIHWRLYKEIDTALEQFSLVGPQSRTFWYLTQNAHAETAIQSLCRAYDQNSTALHLYSWLMTIQQNLHLFQAAEFKKRLAGNPFADSLVEGLRPPDTEQLALDISKCSTSDLMVRGLMQHRNNVSAHRNAKTTADGRSSAHFAVPIADLEALLDRAHEIVNRYSNLFVATTYSRQMVGHDDYRYIFKCVQEAVEKSREEEELLLSRTLDDSQP